MAIDKGLPNVEQTIKLPSPKDVQIEQQSVLLTFFREILCQSIEVVEQ